MDQYLRRIEDPVLRAALVRHWQTGELDPEFADRINECPLCKEAIEHLWDTDPFLNSFAEGMRKYKEAYPDPEPTPADKRLAITLVLVVMFVLMVLVTFLMRV